MNSRENSEMRDLTMDELELISGGLATVCEGCTAMKVPGYAMEIFWCTNGDYGVRLYGD
jgi:hypothetical protein